MTLNRMLKPVAILDIGLPQTSAVDALVRAHATTLSHPMMKATIARYFGEVTI